VRFKIEYLTESTDEKTVCYARFVRVETLDEGGHDAWEGSFIARRMFGARGFQIRDLMRNGDIVALEKSED
jgi:hypothetical protein